MGEERLEKWRIINIELFLLNEERMERMEQMRARQREQSSGALSGSSSMTLHKVLQLDIYV